MALSSLSQTYYNSGGGGGGMGGSSALNNFSITQAQFMPQPVGGSRIKVAVRIRPLLDYERQGHHETQRMVVKNHQEVM